MALETVTVLFTDLVGSTELMARVGESRADDLRREHFALLRRALTEAGGREVKNLGDGVMVVFDAAAAALGCAVAMQQAIAARPSDVEPLSIRIGVSTGEAEVDDDDYFGVPVVEASRLCALAEGGETLVADLVRMLVRSRGGFEFDELGPTTLKGIPDPVEVHRLRWEPRSRQVSAEIPLVRAVTAVGTGTVVGRTAERDVLDVAFKAVVAGERRGVLVSGEPGIGKTTLTTSFAIGAAAQGATVLYGRCDEDLHVPYQPWTQALGHLIDHVDEAVVEAHVAEFGHVVGRLTPSLHRRIGATLAPSSEGGAADGGSDRHQLLQAALDLLDRAAASAPVVVLLDDLHWADSGTVQLLRHLLTTGTAPRVMVLATYRDSDVGPDHPLADTLARLHRESDVARIALRGLGDDELLSLLETLAGHRLEADGLALRDALLAETDGNPFFVTEMLRHLSETGRIYQHTDGRWVASPDLDAAGLPVSVREVVARRVMWLGPETHRVLTMASVIGRDFDLAVLERVVDLDVDTLLDLCDGAVAAAVLREGSQADRYTFSHALVERSLYDELSAGRRARAHLAVAEALEELCGADPGDRVGELAHHWSRATRPHDARKALDYARRAGDHAMSKLAPAEALRWYGDALALLDVDEQRSAQGIELRLAMGRAMRANGDEANRAVLLAAAQDALLLEDNDLLTTAALLAATGYPPDPGLVDAEVVALLRAVLGRLGERPSVDRARLLAALAAHLIYRSDHDDERRALCEQSIEIARSCGVERDLVEVVLLCDEGRQAPDTAPERHRAVLEAAAVADRLDVPSLMLDVHARSAMCCLQVADRDGFDRHRAAVDVALGRLGNRRHLLASASNLTCYAAQFAGVPDDIDTAYAHHLEMGKAAGMEAATLVMWRAGVMTSSRLRGQLAPLLPIIEQTVADNAGLPVFRGVLARALGLERQFDRVRALLDAERELDFQFPRNASWLFSSSLWLEAAHAVGDARTAATVVPRIEPWREQITTSGATVDCCGAHFAGLGRHLLGDLDLAVDHLEVAMAIHQRMRAPYMGAQSELALAAVLADRRRDSDVDRARALVDSAASVADERSYVYLQRTIADLRHRLVT